MGPSRPAAALDYRGSFGLQHVSHVCSVLAGSIECLARSLIDQWFSVDLHHAAHVKLTCARRSGPAAMVLAPTIPLLLRYVVRSRAKAPAEGIACPDNLLLQLAANSLHVFEATVTDGNCGLHAFAIGIWQLAQRYAGVRNHPLFRKLSAARKTGTAEVCRVLREAAISWMRANRNTPVWDGMPFAMLAVAMATFSGGFDAYLEHMSGNGVWVDAAVLHALACEFRVDVAVWQCDQDPSFVGISMSGDGRGPARDVPILTIAMVNDLHYWGCEPMPDPPAEPRDTSDGDVFRNWAAASAAASSSDSGKRPSSEDPTHHGDAHEEPEIEMDSLFPEIPAQEVEAELALCQCLREWEPWQSPTEELTKAVQALSAVTTQASTSSRLLLRSQVMADLAYEEAPGCGAGGASWLGGGREPRRAGDYMLLLCSVLLSLSFHDSMAGLHEP